MAWTPHHTHTHTEVVGLAWPSFFFCSSRPALLLGRPANPGNFVPIAKWTPTPTRVDVWGLGLTEPVGSYACSFSVGTLRGHMLSSPQGRDFLFDDCSRAFLCLPLEDPAAPTEALACHLDRLLATLTERVSGGGEMCCCWGAKVRQSSCLEEGGGCSCRETRPPLGWQGLRGGQSSLGSLQEGRLEPTIRAPDLTSTGALKCPSLTSAKNRDMIGCLCWQLEALIISQAWHTLKGLYLELESSNRATRPV